MTELVFSEESLAVDGVPLRCCAAGTGPALLWLTGLGGLRISRAHELMAKHRRVVAVEPPGFSEAPASRRQLADYSALLNQAAVALDIERYDLIGHGPGAALALAMALARPEPVAAIVLFAPLAIRPHRLPAEIGPGLLYAHPERQPASSLHLTLERETAERLLSECGDPAFEAALRNLRIPVLSLFGTEDRLAPTETARLYRTLLPQGHIAMVYDAAHALDQERPEAVASIAADFLARGERFIVSNEPGLINP